MPRIDLRLDPRHLQNETPDMPVKGAAGYPPFDVIRLRDEPEGVFLRISIAVAGFTEDELEIVAENNQLLVAGLHEDKGDRDFLYRGIAARQFKRFFQLASGMDVIRAHLDRGLLNIDIARRPERVRKINISVSE